MHVLPPSNDTLTQGQNQILGDHPFIVQQQVNSKRRFASQPRGGGQAAGQFVFAQSLGAKPRKKKRKHHGAGLPQLPQTKVSSSKKAQAWTNTLFGRFGEAFGL